MGILSLEAQFAWEKVVQAADKVDSTSFNTETFSRGV